MENVCETTKGETSKDQQEDKKEVIYLLSCWGGSYDVLISPKAHKIFFTFLKFEDAEKAAIKY